MIKVFGVEGVSRIAPDTSSLALSARITDILDYLQTRGSIFYAIARENDDRAESILQWADVMVSSGQNISSNTLNLAMKAKQRGIKIIFDIDDWIFSYPEYSSKNDQADKLDNIKKHIELASVITTANPILMKELASYCAHPILMPNSVYIEKYMPSNCTKANKEANPPRIVFTNADFMKIIKEKDALIRALQVFFMRHPDYILDFIGDPFPEMFSLPFLHFNNRVSYPDYMQGLVAGGYQFAITPLGSDEEPESLFFNSCKSPVKYLNYAAACIPGIYSSSPIYKECIRDSITGLLVENTYESWLNGLETMASRPELRQSIRENAYNDVLNNHHIRSSADALMNLLSSAPKKVAKLGTA